MAILLVSPCLTQKGFTTSDVAGDSVPAHPPPTYGNCVQTTFEPSSFNLHYV